MAFPILDMTPTGRYANGAPIYSFNTRFPTRGVGLLKRPDGNVDVRATPAEAQMSGEVWALTAAPFGVMHEMIGITRLANGRYAAVVNSYYSAS